MMRLINATAVVLAVAPAAAQSYVQTRTLGDRAWSGSSAPTRSPRPATARVDRLDPARRPRAERSDDLAGGSRCGAAAATRRGGGSLRLLDQWVLEGTSRVNTVFRNAGRKCWSN